MTKPFATFLNAVDPVEFAKSLGITLDPWQCDLIRCPRDTLCLNHRQSGKSFVASILIWTAKFRPGSLCLVLAPSDRQSRECFRHIRTFINRLEPVEVLEADNARSCELANGSRVVSIPGGNSDTIRGFSAPALIFEDEASFVSDEVHEACAPMLLVGRGRHVLASTPGPAQGHFHRHWHDVENQDWLRIKLTVDNNPRISPEQIAKLKRRTPEWRWNAEYLCQWQSGLHQIFSDELVASALDPSVKPLFTKEQLAELMAA